MTDLAKLLDALGRDPAERMSLNGVVDGRFRSELTSVGVVARWVPDPAKDCWFGAAVLHPRVTSGRGYARDVVGVRELYADLDVKAGGMPSWDAARAVVDTLSDMLGAGPVAVVNSGHGLQPHWALERSDATDWRDEADPRWGAAVALWRRWGRLVAHVAETYGGSVDGAFDLARILRSPGTANTKGDPHVPVTAEWTAGAPVSLDRLAETLDEYNVDELTGDRDTLGEIAAPPTEWSYGSETCRYVAKMVAGWSVDSPDARHPWLMSQAVRLACAHRLGCITKADQQVAAQRLGERFTYLVTTTGDRRGPQPGEITDGLSWGVARAATFNDQRARAELGDHGHNVDKLDRPGGAGAAADPGRYFGPKVGFLVATLADDIAASGALAEGGDDIMWRYSGGVWLPDRHVVRRRATELLGERYRRGHGANAEDVVRARSPQIACEPIPDIINFRNGLYEWRVDRLKEHSPDVPSTVQLAVEWTPTATCPTFNRWLAQVVPADMIEVAWELIGYLMYSGNPLHKAVMLMGTGRNGKGTFLRAMTALLGHHNVTSVSLHDLVNTRFSTASLFGKIANIAGDIDASYLENTAVFKAITGGDSISAEHKGRDRFDFTPWAVPVFSANKVPPSADVTVGYLSRWLVVPFPNDFTGREDRTLDRQLAAELPGIAATAMPALRRLLACGDFTLPESGQQARDEFSRRVDQVRAWIDDCCEAGNPEHFTPRSELYTAYEAWTYRTGHHKVRSTEFYDRLDAIHGCRPTRRGSGTRGYAGLAVSRETPGQVP